MKLEYTVFERLPCPRPVDKLEWLTNFCRGRSVLDLGAYDETAVDLKRDTPYWLHARLSRVASQVVGVDSSEHLPATGLHTSTTSVIVRGDVMDLQSVQLDHSPDIVVGGELIEHLPNAVEFLRGLKANGRLLGSTVLLTTPNASAFYNTALGVFGRESTHHDHLAVHSFKTLSTLCSRVGLDEWEIIPYYSRFPEVRMSSSGFMRLAVIGFEKLVNVVESLFPLLSGGWIVKFRL